MSLYITIKDLAILYKLSYTFIHESVESFNIWC